jgi:GLPGLI family protein
MKNILFSTLILISPLLSAAQFSVQGKIDYERKTNLRLQLQTEDDNEWMKSMAKRAAQHTISDFTMTFNRDESEYEFVKEQEVKGETFSWGPKPAHENKVYTNFRTGKMMAQKQVYENNYLVEGELAQLKWKIENDMRMIAGYPCRKATTRICDSVVVVAFYTDQIMVSGGPEGFGGLPGMILGLAVPRLYTTWFATNVQLITPEVKAFVPARKSKKVTAADMIAEVQKSTKDWGKYGANLIWWLSL